MFWTTCKIFLALLFITGCAYPFLITEIAHWTVPHLAQGSLVVVDGKVRGSELIGQAFTEDRYFWPRPSSNNYDALLSGGSNLGPTSKKLKELVQERAQKLSAGKPDVHVPVDLVYASGSGLDPHINEKAALFQIERIAKARQLSVAEEAELRTLIDAHKERRLAGFLGHKYYNVLKLNMLLDKHYPIKKNP